MLNPYNLSLKPMGLSKLPLCFGIAALLSPALIQAASPDQSCTLQIKQATYTQPTKRYAHAVLGDDVEYGAIKVLMQEPQACGGKQKIDEVVLPHSLVFEDLEPRLVDVSGDNKPEIITVESSASQGARLSIWGISAADTELTRLATTPYIGTPYRWLAPIGAADFDNDGHIEIAYVDRPHLAKQLKVWRYKNGKLNLVTQQQGFSNHRIGEDFISGGIRNCGKGYELITANSTWSKIMATRLTANKLISRDLGSYLGQQSRDQKSFAKALACKPPYK